MYRNSLYGALLNEYMRFYDQRIGQSTTLNGRNITKHMTATINQVVTGDYDPTGPVVIYGDSVTAETIIQTSIGDMPIKELFDLGQNRWSLDDKDYSNSEILIKSYDPRTETPVMLPVHYVMEHKSTKDLYLIEDEDGNTITVTADHSIMVERDGQLVKVKPTEILDGDLLIIDK